MHIEHPRRRLVSHLSSAVLTFAAATTITSATTHAQPGAAVSSTQPGADGLVHAGRNGSFERTGAATPTQQ